jgi:acyl carrier protein
METTDDITVLAIGRAAENVLGRRLQVSAASDIAHDLAVDSLALMNIVMELEDSFDISIPLDRLAQVQTVGDLAALIGDLRKKA